VGRPRPRHNTNTHRLADAEVRPGLELRRVLGRVLQVLSFTAVDEDGKAEEAGKHDKGRDVLPELLAACRDPEKSRQGTCPKSTGPPSSRRKYRDPSSSTWHSVGYRMGCLNGPATCGPHNATSHIVPRRPTSFPFQRQPPKDTIR